MQPSYHRGYMPMSMPIMWTTWRNCPHQVKGKAGGDLKSGQLNQLNQAEKGRKKAPLKPWLRQFRGLLRWGTEGGKIPLTQESLLWGGEQESITQTISLLNEHTDVDHFTYCKVVMELHNPKSKAAFFAMTVDRERAWIEFIGGGLQ